MVDLVFEKRKRHILAICLKLLGWLMGGLAIYGVLWGLGSDLLGQLPSHIEIPLGVETIAVDSVGNVYCGDYTYSRIQIYDPEGSFIRAYHIPINVFDHYIDQEDSLHLWGSYGEYRKYSRQGELVIDRKDVDQDSFPEHGKSLVRKVSDASGNIYRIRGYSWWWPQVTKTTPAGKTRVVVSQPFYLWLIKIPQPAWLFGLIGVMYHLFVKYVRHLRSITPEPTE